MKNLCLRKSGKEITMKERILLLTAVMAMLACADTALEKPLFEDGRLELGMNYWASETATRMWRDWRPESIEKDLETLEKCGVTVLRVFPTWSDFQPIVEIHTAGPDFAAQHETRMMLDERPLPDTPAGRAGLDETMLERFAQFCDMAERHNMKLIVGLITGHMTFRLFIPPALENRNPQSDPVALEWEAKFIEGFIRAMKGKKAIAAWACGNEVKWFGKVESRAHGAVWLRYITNQIRLSDSSRPIVGMDGFGDNPVWSLEDNAAMCDWIPHHLYELNARISPDAITSIRSALFLAARCGAVESASGRPTFVEEHGVRRAEMASPENVARFLHNELWNSWAANLRSIIWWCAFDQDKQTCAPYEWIWPCLELGMFRSDRTPYPAVDVASRFVKFAASQPALPKAKPDALFIVGDENDVHASYILARQAGIMPEFQRADMPLRDSAVYFLVSVKQRGKLTASRWNALREKVREGATLYLSIDDDCYLHSMDSFCGMQTAERTFEPKRIEADFGGFTISLERPTSPVYESCGAEVLAKDKDGSPVFFRNRYGKGVVYTLALPLERLLYKKAGGFATDACRIYGKILGVPQLVDDGARDVTTSFHYVSEAKAYVPVVNNSPVAYDGRPTVAEGWCVTDAATDAPELAKFSDGRLSLGPNCGILLTVERK